MIKSFIILTLKNIKYRPIRSWLTILGIIIGTMLVVAILSLGSGIESVIMSKLQMLGSQTIIIFPGDETNPFLSILSGIKFREKDIMDLENINGVQDAIPFDMGALTAEYRGEKKSVTIHSSYWDKMRRLFEITQGFELESGRWPLNDSVDEVVLGNVVAKKSFKRAISVGDELILRSKRMKVVGIMKYIGAQDDDTAVYLSWQKFHMLAETKPAAISAMLVVEKGYDINLVARQVKYQLSQQEVVDKFAVLTPDKVKKLAGDILGVVELALILIALVSLLVGAVGIMNTMYTSVLERTKQIGIMKAVGASSEGILTLFLIESGVIGVIGGLLGIIFGVVITFVAGIAARELAGISGLFSFAALDYLGFLAVLVVTFVTGLIAGILPARQASKMEPAEALRYE